MNDEMNVTEYLANGGRLTAPGNVPPRYRAELLRIMASFVDSQLAGAAGFADVINTGPGIKERIAAARIVLEKTDHADRVLSLMGEFGADTARYATHHPWTARLPRDAKIDAQRMQHDMRMRVFDWPLDGWADAVVMNLLMGHAACVQIADLTHASYQPLADAMRGVLPVETRHVELAAEGAARLEADDLTRAVAYWWPRVAGSFGTQTPEKLASLRGMGLRHTSSDEQRATWAENAAAALRALGLRPPA